MATPIRFTFDLKTVHALHTQFRRGGTPQVLQEAGKVLQESPYAHLLGTDQDCVLVARDLYDLYREYGNAVGLDGFSLRNDYSSWSSEQVSTLNYLASEGRYTWPQIADMLGRTPRAVRWKHEEKDPGVKANDLYNTLFTERTFDRLTEEMEHYNDSGKEVILAGLRIREGLESSQETLDGIAEIRELIQVEQSLAGEEASDEENEPEALDEEPSENTCEEPPTHESITTMTDTAVEPVKKGIWAQISRSVGKQAARIGVTAGGAAITTLVYQVTVKGALKAGLPKETTENPFFQIILKMGIPTILRASAKRIPVLQDMTVLDKMLQSSQHVVLGQATRHVMNEVMDLAGSAVQHLMASDNEEDEDEAVEADEAADVDAEE